MKKYLMIDQVFNNSGDVISEDCEVYDTVEEADAGAIRRWNYLTARERKNSKVYVAEVTEADLADWAVDDETGEIDWRCYEQYNPLYEVGKGRKTMRKVFEEILEDNGIFGEDVEDVLNAVEEMLYVVKEKIAKEEPNANRTLDRLWIAQQEVSDLIYCLDEEE